MFENFKKITIKGGCFENDTELELFRKDPLSIVYGRNGSGKTTISHGIAELTKLDDEKDSEYTVSSDVAISDAEKQSVFVFNEDFVRDQVRVEKDGINTIVMLGEQVEIDNQIKEKNVELAAIIEQWGELDSKKKQYEDPLNPNSPLYVFSQIRDALREEDGWADIDRDVKGNTLKSRITDEVVDALLGIEEPKESISQLRERVFADLTLFRQSESAQAIAWASTDIFLPDTLESISTLLEKPLDAPILSDREQRLIGLLALHPQHSAQETRQMVDEYWPFCPMCLREIKDEDRTAIKATLTHILNKEAEDYEGNLVATLNSFASIETALPDFCDGLYEKELNAAIIARTNLNKILNVVRETIGLRKRSIYEPLKNPFEESFSTAYVETLKTWKAALLDIQQCVDEFNDSVNKRNHLFDKVREENNLLARKQLSSLLQSYKLSKDNCHTTITEWNAKELEKNRIESEIDALKARKERTDIALDYINHELQYVFYSNRKVQLEPGLGCYKLRVNGRNVRPSKISVGERNVLGLCYFFAKLYSGKTESSKYSSELLIVIDDPVSSFDYGNRIGVMSLLRYQFNSILKGNANSRIIVMTHDLHSVFDLVKIRNEVVPGRRADKVFMELINRKLEVKPVQNEYKKLLDRVFEYAVYTGADDLDEKKEMSIGNIMRRTLEAFSSFCYNETFEKMVRKEDVLACIPNEKRSYYESFMGRLTLNGESHMEENVYSLDTMTAFFTKEEKVQTAKSLLLFLFHINRPHLSAYMDATQLATIEGWQTEEEGWLL